MSCRRRAGRLPLRVRRSRHSRLRRRGWMVKTCTVDDALEHGEQAAAGDAELAEMHALAQRIAPREDAGEMLRQRLDDRDLKREPPVLHQVWQRVALLQKDPGTLRQPCEAASQLGRRLGRTERLDAEAASGEGVGRDIDAVPDRKST